MSDITLDSVAYNVQARTYERSNDHFDGVSSGVWSQSDFIGGQLRAMQLERDRGWGGINVGPALLGQGVEPWPWNTNHTDGNIATASTLRIPSILLGDHVYCAITRYLYKSVSLSAGTWANWTQVYDAGSGNTITHLAHQGGKVICCINNGVAMNAHTPGSPGSNAVWMAGEIGWRAVGYAGQLVWARQNKRDELRLSTSSSTYDTRPLDSDVQMMCLHDGKIAIATRTSLYLLGGRPVTISGTTSWQGEPEPFYTHGIYTDDEDFQFLLSFGGKLYTWAGNEVLEWNGRSDRAGWRSVGLSGQSCHGATVAGNWLVVAITARTGRHELWAYDGTGWWLIHQHASQARVWPIYVAGAGNVDVVAFRSGSGSGIYELFRLVYRHTSAQTYPTSSTIQYVTSMIDDAHPELWKEWQQVGFGFATPEIRGNPASVTPVFLTFEASIDGGSTWTSLGSVGILNPAVLTQAGVYNLTTGSTSTHLMIRVSWGGVTDWAPVLTNIWASWRSASETAPARRWKMTIRATDRSIRRDGSVDPRTGREIMQDLWDAWETNRLLPFTDIDYADTNRTYAVLIAGIKDVVSNPEKDPVFHESAVTITLVEVGVLP